LLGEKKNGSDFWSDGEGGKKINFKNSIQQKDRYVAYFLYFIVVVGESEFLII
jgi:hypothetical protein